MMARTPEQNRAIYQRRKARLAEQGKTVYSARGVEVQTPAGVVIASFDQRRVERFLRAAGHQPVKVLVDIRDGPQLTIFAHYGWDAAAMRRDIRAEEDPPRVKRAILKWLDEERGTITGGPPNKRGSRPVSRRRRDLEEEPEEEDDQDLIELGDLLKAQFVTVQRREAAA